MAKLGRTATVVLVTRDGGLLGKLAPVEVSTPWWPDVEPVVRAIRERDGIDVTILRLLDGASDEPRGGAVMYLGEASEPVAADPWSGALDDHPLRLSYARPGGPAADLTWAAAVLAERGFSVSGPPVQVKTWNLSSLWRIPIVGGGVWLKVVPPFFSHEGSLLALMAGERVPTLIAEDACRMLVAEIPGDDLYAADLPLLLRMVTLLVDVQVRWTRRVDELARLRLPDWRADAMTERIEDVVNRTAPELTVEDRQALDSFVRTLPDRYAQVAACGLSDSLVHGDFTPLNVRGGPDALTVLDWGDSGIGHPLLDQAAFLERVAPGTVDAVRQHWVEQWREVLPNGDPEGAFALMAPVALARQAVVYRNFLDNIEPAEHIYHRGDPADRLRRVARLARHSHSN